MSKFNSKNKKLNKLWNENEDSEKKIKRLNRNTIKINHNAFNKRIVEIPIFNGLIETSAPIVCWVSSAIFGSWTNKKTQITRYYIINYSPKWFYNIYRNNGEEYAKTIKKHLIYRILLFPFFYFMYLLGTIYFSRDKKNEL